MIGRAGLVALAVLSGCSFDAEILVRVSSNLTTSEAASVAIALAPSEDAEPVVERCVCLVAPCEVGTPGTLPVSASLRPGSQGDRPFRVIARAHVGAACAGEPLVEAKAKVRFTRDTSRELDLLLSRACAGVRCGAEETCDPGTGACVSDDLPTPEGDLGLPTDPPDLALVTRAVAINAQIETVHAVAAVGVGSELHVAWLGDIQGTYSVWTARLAGGVLVGMPTQHLLPAGSIYGGLCAAQGGEALFVITSEYALDELNVFYGLTPASSPELFEIIERGPSKANPRCAGTGGAPGGRAIVIAEEYYTQFPSNTSVRYAVRGAGARDKQQITTVYIEGPSMPVIDTYAAAITSGGTSGGSIAVAWGLWDGTNRTLNLDVEEAAGLPTHVLVDDPRSTGLALDLAYGAQGLRLAYPALVGGMPVLAFSGVDVGTQISIASVPGGIAEDGIAMTSAGAGYRIAYRTMTGELHLITIDAAGNASAEPRNLALADPQFFALASNEQGDTIVVWPEIGTGGVIRIVGKILSPP